MDKALEYLLAGTQLNELPLSRKLARSRTPVLGRLVLASPLPKATLGDEPERGEHRGGAREHEESADVGVAAVDSLVAGVGGVLDLVVDEDEERL